MYSALNFQKSLPGRRISTEATEPEWQISRPHNGEDLVWVEDQEEEGEVVAEDEVEEAERAPQQRRGPVRERWIFRQDAIPAKQAAQPPAPPARVPRRRTKPPDYLGIEKGRCDDAKLQLDLSPPLAADLFNLSHDLAERMLSTSLASSHATTPITTPLTTPMETPETSPDTSALVPPMDNSWELEPMPCSLTAAERAADPTQRHRHWSFTGPGVYPNHPRFLNWFGEWDPGPRKRRSTEH